MGGWWANDNNGKMGIERRLKMFVETVNGMEWAGMGAMVRNRLETWGLFH